MRSFELITVWESFFIKKEDWSRFKSCILYKWCLNLWLDDVQEDSDVKLSFTGVVAAPTASVHLMFSSPLTKSTVEKFRGHIMQAFFLESPVTIAGDQMRDKERLKKQWELIISINSRLQKTKAQHSLTTMSPTTKARRELVLCVSLKHLEASQSKL